MCTFYYPYARCANHARSARCARCARCPQEAKARQQALAPYVVTAPKRGVIGNSRYAQRLRREIVQASRDKSR